MLYITNMNHAWNCCCEYNPKQFFEDSGRHRYCVMTIDRQEWFCQECGNSQIFAHGPRKQRDEIEMACKSCSEIQVFKPDRDDQPQPVDPNYVQGWTEGESR